jgi:glyceraldehyde-3-phosphate dehydrogenase/erythrose-4-phosphate dehydrogenase
MGTTVAINGLVRTGRSILKLVVSSDIVGDPSVAVVDLEFTKVIDGDQVEVLSWYDKEWGCANQVVGEAVSVAAAP